MAMTMPASTATTIATCIHTQVGGMRARLEGHSSSGRKITPKVSSRIFRSSHSDQFSM
jgi:hypothetical protein